VWAWNGFFCCFLNVQKNTKSEYWHAVCPPPPHPNLT
jgi:hypothetical protein